MCLLTCYLLATTTVVHGQEKGPRERLWQAKSVRVTLGNGYTASWEDRRENLLGEDRYTPDAPHIIFDSIDHEKGTARMIARSVAEVMVIRNAGGLWFLHRTAGGSATLTTIFASGGKDPIRYFCVHSKHTVGIGDLVPNQASQWYGTARIVE